MIGYVSPLKSLSLDGNKTRRKISPEAKRKLDRNPLARKHGLRFKSWRKW
ncbi:MAG: hypothetical protein P8Y23_02810 [Candidatus Lokiarchaeota archaeon]